MFVLLRYLDGVKFAGLKASPTLDTFLLVNGVNLFFLSGSCLRGADSSTNTTAGAGFRINGISDQSFADARRDIFCP